MSATVAQTVADSARDLRQWFARSLWGDNLLLILLLISGDLRLFQVLLNAEGNFKSFRPVENKRHTNAQQLSPPSQQQRLQSPLSAIAKIISKNAPICAALLFFLFLPNLIYRFGKYAVRKRRKEEMRQQSVESALSSADPMQVASKIIAKSGRHKVLSKIV